MSYFRIDNMADVDQAYKQVVQDFGKSILKDKYRTLGAFLDIAPKMKDEAQNLVKAFDAEVPQHFAEATSMDKATAQQLQKALIAQGMDSEDAIDFLENLGAATGIKVNIRPDYTQGGMIPYVSHKGDSLTDAIRNLDHIRWFLNNVKRYQTKGQDSAVKELRKLMNNAAKNAAELASKYSTLVHKFENDPFAASFSLDGSRPGGEIHSSDFGAYFIVVGGAPVAIEFARQFGGPDYLKALGNLNGKSAAVIKKIESYYNEVNGINIPEDTSGQAKRKAVGFSIASLIVLIAINAWLNIRWHGAGLQTFLSALSKAHFSAGSVFKCLSDMHMMPQFIVILIVSSLIALCSLLLLIGIIRTLANASKVKSNKGPAVKKKQLLTFYSSTLPGKVKQMKDDIQAYASGSKKSLELNVTDASKQAKEIQELRKSVGLKSAGVRICGKAALGWLIFLAIVSSIMSATKLKVVAGLQPDYLGEYAGRLEKFEDSVIPYDALEYNGHYYAIFDDASNYLDAYKYCQRLGGHMVSITDEGEEIAVATYLRDSAYYDAFIGCWYEGGNWYWTGYQPVAYSDWTPGEPSIGDYEDCLYGAMLESDGYQWRALSESYLTTYICEWDSFEAGQVNPIVKDIPMNALSYGGHYYAIYSDAEDYDEARELCRERGGYMCVINDGGEDVTLYDYCYSQDLTDVFFGYSDQDIEGKWQWVEEGGYSDSSFWSPGEPNGGTSENHAQFYYGSEPYYWNDAEFYYGAYYICEWDLSTY